MSLMLTSEILRLTSFVETYLRYDYSFHLDCFEPFKGLDLFLVDFA
jgi:hypothetical protein